MNDKFRQNKLVAAGIWKHSWKICNDLRVFLGEKPRENVSGGYKILHYSRPGSQLFESLLTVIRGGKFTGFV